MIPISDGMNVAAELAGLRGEMVAGFARLEGRLDLIASGQNRTEADVSNLQQRVSDLEARRIPIGPMAALSGAISAVVTVVAFVFQAMQ